MSESVYYADSQHIRKRKRQHDKYNTEEDVTMTGKDNFRVDEFLPIIDPLCAALQKRLEAYSKFCEKFGFYPI